MNLEKIGEFVTKLRIEKKLSIKEFAKKIKLYEKTLIELESGQTLPNVEEISKICEELKITKTEFFKAKKMKNTKEDEEFLSSVINLSCYLTKNKYKKLTSKILLGIFVGVSTILIYNNIINFRFNTKKYNIINNPTQVSKDELVDLKEIIMNKQGTYTNDQYSFIKGTVENIMLLDSKFKTKNNYTIKEMQEYTSGLLNFISVYGEVETNEIYKIILSKKPEMIDNLFKYKQALNFFHSGYFSLIEKTNMTRNYRYETDEYLADKVNYSEAIRLSSIKFILNDIIEAGDLNEKE